jgi:NADH:ubiquinone oxidoreductase subunit 5 (subunit L)/multisubunit Na+/H+ antiporter MnhA subunit
MSSFGVVIGLLAITLVGFIAWRLISRVFLVARENSNVKAAHDYFNHIHSSQKLTTIESSILLMPGELAFLESAAELCEKKPSLFYMDELLNLGEGASAVSPRLNVLQAGVLVLTQERLVFVSWLETRSAQLRDIVSAKDWVDSVELRLKPSLNSEFYCVENPIIWSRLIEGMALGRFRSLINVAEPHEG